MGNRLTCVGVLICASLHAISALSLSPGVSLASSQRSLCAPQVQAGLRGGLGAPRARIRAHGAREGVLRLQGALKIRVINVSKGKESWSEEACGDFAKRVRRFGVEVEELTLKPAPGPPKRTVDEQREEEGKDILSRVSAVEGPLVVLDERGDQLDSFQFAKYLQDCADQGDRVATFAIGGANGHSPEVQQAAKARGRMISFGKMVMNHQVCRVVLWEQIYRAMTINNNVPYHK